MTSSASKIDDNQGEETHGVSGLIRSLSNEAQIFIFSYNPGVKCLMSWTDNLGTVLGVQAVAVAREANLFLRYVHPDDRFKVLTAFESALQGKSPYQITYRWNRPDNNRTRWLHCRAALVDTPEGKLFEGCIVDLTDEMRDNQALIDSPDFVESVVNALPDAALTLDRDLRVLRVQEGMEKLAFDFGDRQFLRHKLRPGFLFGDVFLSASRRDHYTNLCSKILTGTLTRHSERHSFEGFTYELQLLPILVGESVDGVLILVRDISQQIAAENRLAELERGEALKQLAVGLAHNINNTLQSVLGQALAIRENTDSPQILENSTKAIIDLVSKASSLTSQLFALDSQSDTSRSPVDLNLAAMTAVNKIEDVFSSGLKIAVAFGNPPIIMVERPVLERVLEHLLRTVFEVNPEQSNITITTYQVSLADNEINTLKGGTYARLTISDKEQSDEAPVVRAVKSDDPVYMTFLPAKNLVEELGGSVYLERYATGGISLSLYFPVEVEALQTSPAPELVNDISPHPNVMIIDDDLMVLDTVQRLLVNAGYNCLAAEDSHKALSLVRKHKDTIKVILLDALMPGMNGARLLKKLREIKADFQVIGFSGAPPEITRSLLEGGAVRILRKPVDPTQLKATVSELYQGKQAAA